MASEDEDTTVLVISGPGIAPYSARGLTQTLEPIAAAANLRRTVNGSLLDVSASQFRKYRSTISCADQQAPALDNVWPGMLLTVDCAAYLAYPVAGSAGRVVVPDSEYTEGNYVFYRPRLSMRVVQHTQSKDEYGAVTSWSLDLEEA